MIKRDIQGKVEKSLFRGKIVVIYGARQVGKTTMVKAIQKKYKESAYFNCDEPSVRRALTNKTSKELASFIGKHKLIILDEAQRVSDIGLTLKLLIDTYPEIQVLATGSSSFDLANKVIEPLTGRKYEFYLYPFSVNETMSFLSQHDWDYALEQRLIYGMYPNVMINDVEKETIVREIARSYVFKDILTFDKIRNSEALEKLLQALALQIGSEVSYNELADTVGINKDTVRDYIRILEQSFIIFRLRPFRRNVRTELRKLRKIYFYDLGIRNALINNLNPLNLRTDKGALWENFLITERLKYLSNNNLDRQTFFWRTQQREEIDYVESYADELEAYEFKWKDKKKVIAPKKWRDNYPNAKFQLITSKNYQKFLK